VKFHRYRCEKQGQVCTRPCFSHLLGLVRLPAARLLSAAPAAPALAAAPTDRFPTARDLVRIAGDGLDRLHGFRLDAPDAELLALAVELLDFRGHLEPVVSVEAALRLTELLVEIRHAGAVLPRSERAAPPPPVRGEHVVLSEDAPAIVLQIEGVICKHAVRELAGQEAVGGAGNRPPLLATIRTSPGPLLEDRGH